MKTAYAYIKTCAGEPASDKVIAHQQKAIERYAQEQGIKIVGKYSDLNVDAENEMGRRYGLYEMMEDAKQNGVSCVVVTQSVSIAHDDVVRAVLLAILEGSGTCVLSTLDGADLYASNDQALSLARKLLPVYMEFKAIWRPVELRMARNRIRHERGRCEGAKPFGHYLGEQETLDRMLQLRRKPRNKPERSYQAIADTLNAEGRPTRRGGPWMKATVRRIILHQIEQDSITTALN